MIRSGIPIVVPPALSPSDTVAIVSPAGPVRRGALEAGERFLLGRGYTIKRGRNVLARQGYLAGTDRQRLSDLNRAFADPTIKAVFCTRGGYGTTRLLDGLDLAPLARHPKIIMGYSDLTVLLNLVTHRMGLVTYLGPVVGPDMGRGLRGRTLSSFEAMLEGGSGKVQVRCRPGRIVPRARRGFLRTGQASGPLVGGCLTMIAAALGTDWAVPLEGRVLFWEEVNEPAYRLDRLLTQLRQAGAFDGLSGMIIGRLRNCGAGSPDGLRGLVSRLVGSLPCPVFYGFPSGHGPEKVVLPVGLPVTLDSTRGVVGWSCGS